MSGKPPIAKFKSGNIEMCIWEGSYEGKTTYSASMRKQILDKQSNQWKDSNFYTKIDIMNIKFLSDLVLQKLYVLNQQSKQSPPQPQQYQNQTANNVANTFAGQQQPSSDDNIPF